MPNPVPTRSEAHLDHIRQQPCVICGSPAPNDPHHLDSGVMGGKGSDLTCVPMCRTHHREYHSKGEQWVEQHYRVNFWKQAHRLLSRYIDP